MASDNGKPKRNGKPNKLAENGESERDEKGRYLPGHKSTGGRPKGIDYRKVCEEKAAEEGYDLERAIWEVTKELIENAKGRTVVKLTDKGKAVEVTIPGDPKSQALLFDRQCGPVKQYLDMTSGDEPIGTGPTPPQGTDRVAWLRKLLEIAERRNGTSDG